MNSQLNDKFDVKNTLIKWSVILGLIVFFLNMIMPDFHSISKAIEHNLGQPKNKIILLSFVQNPAALMKMAEIDLKESKFDKALLEMELAIGLLEMNGADSTVISKYSSRLEQIKAQSSGQK